MPAPLILHDDRLFPAEPSVREGARDLYGEVKGLPILGPHEPLVHLHAIREVAVDLAYRLPKRAYKL